MCNSIMEAVRMEDGNPVYVKPLRAELDASRLEMEEPVVRLVRGRFVEQMGGYPDPLTLWLTAQGRSHFLGE